jgi:hypothetical protein|nr:MAG TPA: hypothetical protein [Caudoviricetes sp.]
MNKYFTQLKLFLINKEAAGGDVTYQIIPEEVYFIFGNQEITIKADDDEEKIKSILDKLLAL